MSYFYYLLLYFFLPANVVFVDASHDYPQVALDIQKCIDLFDKPIIILDDYGNVVGVAVAKLDLQYAMKEFGSIPENINFGIKSSVVENLIQAHNVNNPSPNKKEMNKSDLGYNIKQATLYLSCWMTLAQIKKFSTKKVIFRDLVN